MLKDTIPKLAKSGIYDVDQCGRSSRIRLYEHKHDLNELKKHATPSSLLLSIAASREEPPVLLPERKKSRSAGEILHHKITES